MLDAIGLHHFRWRKKKAEQFIIPPTYFRRNDYSIVEKVKGNSNDNFNSNEKSQIETAEEKPKVETNNANLVPIENIPENSTRTVEVSPKLETPNLTEGTKISALSISSIRAKKELQENSKDFVKEKILQLSESFNETDMLLEWSKYAQRLGDKGHKIMESLLLIGDPKLEGTTIIHELPNEGSKIEFETEIYGLLGHLKGHLHNHDITIKVVVNEAVENKFAFTPIDKYNRLNEINPNLELLKKTFDLDI